MDTCLHPDCKRSPSNGDYCDRCADWIAIPFDDRPEWCPCVRRGEQVSHLIVTDANGKKYKPTGCFREPKPGEFVYCFDCKRVEWRPLPNCDAKVDLWCSNGHPEFLLHRIIVEPLPVEYEVYVKLTQEEFAAYARTGTPKASDVFGGSFVRPVIDAINRGDFEEVPQP